MPIQYVRLYGMHKLNFWIGTPKPDAPITELDNFLDNTGFEDNKDYFRDDSEPSEQLAADKTKTGYIGYGVNVQRALYTDESLRKVLRVYTIQEINMLFSASSFISVNTFKDALSLGAFGRISLIIKSVDDNVVYPLYGKEHRTTVILSHCAIISEVTSFFLTSSFKIGPNEILYKAVPSSIKLINLKSTSQQLG